MRKSLQSILATTMLLGGIVACDQNNSPTAPEPPVQRTYQSIVVQQGPARLTTYYDQTWTAERARAAAERGLSDGVTLIGMQIGARAFPLESTVFLQGEIPGGVFDTAARYGEYQPFNNQIFCADARDRAPADECIAHQLQHRYAQANGARCWPEVLHYNSEILELVPSTITVTCERVIGPNHPEIVAERVELRECGSD